MKHFDGLNDVSNSQPVLVIIVGGEGWTIVSDEVGFIQSLLEHPHFSSVCIIYKALVISCLEMKKGLLIIKRYLLYPTCFVFHDFDPCNIVYTMNSMNMNTLILLRYANMMDIIHKTD